LFTKSEAMQIAPKALKVTIMRSENEKASIDKTM
jgi:hypothetical protein